MKTCIIIFIYIITYKETYIKHYTRFSDKGMKNMLMNSVLHESVYACVWEVRWG